MHEVKLTLLEPEFVDLHVDGQITRALFFLCPSCQPQHSICVPFAGPSPFPSGAVWKLRTAEDVETVTFEPSIDLSSSSTCRFHGWVQGGMVRW